MDATNRGALSDDEHREQKRRKVSSGQSSTAPSTPPPGEPVGMTTEANTTASISSIRPDGETGAEGDSLAFDFPLYKNWQKQLTVERVPIAAAEFDDLYQPGAIKYTHVDNSKFILCALDQRKCLLIRPRRSGKSTFGRLWLEFLRGNKELFEKLTVGSSEVPAKGEYVCVHLDLSGSKPESFVKFLERRLHSALEFAQLPPIAPQPDVESAIDVFAFAVQNARKKAAFFVDEYDYLVQNANSNYQQAKRLTESLFVALKAHGTVCSHLLATGSSRIAISGIYSGANNIADVSYEEEWATVLGYTWQDISNLYSKQLVMLQELHVLTLEKLKEKIEQWYNGYQFSPDSPTTVFNIWAVNRLLETGKFAPHLSKSGLSCQLVTGELIVSELAMMVHKDYAVPVDIYDIETWRYGDRVSVLSSRVTLLSAGLLTFRGERCSELLCLAVPNQDCRTAIEKVLRDFAQGINVEEFGLKIMSEDILGAIGILQPELHKMARLAAENEAGAEGVLEYHLQQAFFSLLCTLQQRNRTAQWALRSEVRVKRGISPRADFLLKMNFAAGMRYHVIEFGIHRYGNPLSTLSDKLEQALSKYIEVAQNPDRTSITAVLWDANGGLVRGAGPLSATETGTLCADLKEAGSPPDAVRVARSDGTGWV